jgi:hypothetical protein
MGRPEFPFALPAAPGTPLRARVVDVSAAPQRGSGRMYNAPPQEFQQK